MSNAEGQSAASGRRVGHWRNKAVAAALLVLAISVCFLAYENHRLREELLAKAAELEALVGQYEELLSAHENLLARHQGLINAFEALNESHSSLLQRYDELLQDYSALSEQEEQTMARYIELTVAYADLNRTYNSLLSNYTALQQQLVGYQELQARYEALLSEYQLLQSEYSALQENCTKLQSDCAALQSNYTALLGEYQQLLNDYQGLQTDYSALKKRFDEIYSAVYEPLLSNETVTPTLSELRAWLAEDRTDELPYVYPDFVCGDFAAMLSLHAKVKHWDMGVVAVLGHDSRGNEFNHAFNAIRCQEGLYYVEPQNDQVFSGPINEGSWYNHPGFGPVYVEMFIIVILYQPPL